MRSLMTAWVRIILLALLVLAPSAAACKSSGATLLNEPVALGSWEDALVLYAKADSATTGAHLSSNADAPGVAAYTGAEAGAPTSGVSGSVSYTTGTRPGFVEFPAREPLAQPIYLNLSKPVTGALYFSSTVRQTADRGDGYVVRVEAYAGAQRIGGQDHTVLAGAVKAGFYAFHFCFRPEVRSIGAGETVKLRVTRLTSFTDFQIGTSTGKQTFLELRYFAQDPLANAIYVEQGKMIQAPQAGGEEAGAAAASPLLLLGLGLLSLARRDRGMPLLLAAAILAAPLAGCLTRGGDVDLHDASASPSPTAEVSYEDLPTSSSGPTDTPIATGEMRGTVNDPTGFPIEHANVLILATSHFATTGKDGAFSFLNLTPNQYVLRIDREGFESLEQNITVLAGKIARVDVTLPYLAAKTSNDKPHLHDEWGDVTEKEILALPAFKPAWRFSPSISAQATVSAKTAEVQLPASTERSEACAGHGICEADVPLPLGAVVLPGTAMVVVTLTWSATATGAPKEVQLGIETSLNKTRQLFAPRGTGDAFRIPIFPTEADPGHVRFTDWRFYLRLPSTNTQHPFGPLAHAGPTFALTIKIHKGVVPFEPAHRDFWNGLDQLDLFNQVARGPSDCLNCDYPSNLYSNTWSMVVVNGPLVPPDTKEIRGVLSWTGTTGAAIPTQWNVAFRPADMPFRQDQLAAYPRAKITKENPASTEFVIELKPGQADQFYQRLSRWVFFVDDQDDPAAGVNSGYGTTWRLTASAVRDAKA
ncbi:MAG: carboxypeptidase regulatory-like domain-containing protein [Euryarchaeota archaeon]|nr:carboxypeptidase regulatory-like domain-containing protein [Euryarchaeota archaeon]